MSDPCTNCEDLETCDGLNCPHISLKPCETVEGCIYSEHCMGGALCEMILAGQEPDNSHDARELAEFMAEARA